MKNNKEDKIQTGMRIPKHLYDQLSQDASDTGISLNSYMLFLINLGLKVVRQQEDQCDRSSLQNRQDNT